MTTRGHHGLLLVAGGAPPPSSYDAEVLADSPIGYWKLDENTGGTGTTISDSSGNGHHCVATMAGVGADLSFQSEAPVSGLAGIGRSLNLKTPNNGGSGTTVIEDTTPNAVFRLPSGDVTFEFWWNRYSLTPSNTMFFFNGTSNGSTVNYFEVRASSSSNNIVMKASGGTANFNFAHGITGSSWHLIQLILNAARNSVDYYLDGSYVSTHAISGTWIPTGSGEILRIGSRPDLAVLTNAAALNNAAIYNAALSAGRIAAHWAARDI